MVEKLDVMERDFLHEMTNIAIGNAATHLSEMIGQEIKLSVPVSKLMSPAQARKLVMVEKGIAMCTFAKFKGNMQRSALLGSVMLVFDTEDAFAMADLLQKKKIGTTKWLSEIDQKHFLQLGKHVFECYLKAITHFIDIDMLIGDVKLVSTMGDAILDVLFIGHPEGPILAINNRFSVAGGIKARAWFLLFLGSEGVISLLRKAGLA